MPLAEDMDLFDLLVTQVSDAVAVTDAALCIRRWSPGAERLLGWSAAEAVGQPLYSLVRPDMSAEQVEEMRRSAAESPGMEVVSLRRRKDGAEVLLESRVTRLGDPASGVRGFLIVARDVTSLRSLEAAVQESESRYQRVVESLSEGVVVQDRAGTIVACNAAAERILGLTRGQLLGRTNRDPRWRALREDGTPLADDDHPGVIAMRTGERVHGCITGVHTPEGRLRWLSINAELVSLPSEAEPRGVVVTFTDVTEWRAQEQALNDTVRRLNLVMGSTSDGYWDRDLHADRLYLSPHAMRILEVAGPFPLAAESLRERLHPDDLEVLVRQLDDHLADRRERLDLEMRYRRGDGGWRWLHVRGRVVERDANGRAVRIAGALSDVDERHHLREKLEEALAGNVALVARLESALGKVLSGFLPVCAWCKSVRDGVGEWLPLDIYVERHSDALVTHGMCPRCYEREVGEPPAER